MPAVLTKVSQRLISLLKNARNWAGVLGPIVSDVSAESRSLISGTLTISVAAWLRARMIACGVRAGANNPYQLTSSNPGTPDSARVGRSGNARERVRLVTASARSLPVRILFDAENMLRMDI